MLFGVEGLMAGVPVPILVTVKNGVEPGVGLGDGVGAGRGEVCGTAAGQMLMTSLEIVEALSEEVGVVSSVAMEEGLVVLFHVRFLI